MARHKEKISIKVVTTRAGYSAFEKIFNNKDQNVSNMIKWIKNAVDKLPREYGNLILFATLTGLRPDESYKAIDLIKTKSLEYVIMIC